MGFPLKSGWIVKVFRERKTVLGTAWYQLNHASLKPEVERFQIARWFGVCSYRKMKLAKGDRIPRKLCPICGHELENIKYVGLGVPCEEFWIKEFEDEYLDGDERPKWIPKPSLR